MLSLIGFLFGLVSLLGFLIGLIPCLGWFNWVNIPLAIAGAIISSVARGNRQTGGNRSLANAGLIMSLIAIIIGAWRLSVGGGLF